MQKLKLNKAKSVLDRVLSTLDSDEFISNDPIQIAKRFENKQDIEIAAFFSCILAWGQRKTIIKNLISLMENMDNNPYQFIVSHAPSDLKRFEGFVHRTFNTTDCLYFIHSLNRIYSQHNSLENLFRGEEVKDKIQTFQHEFFNSDFVPQRTFKHIAQPNKGSAAKRINMFLRWMVRDDDIDFGIWTNIKKSELMCPLDVHVQRAAWHLDLLERKQSDWRAVVELSNNLRLLDAEDPIKYDLALFRLSEQKMFTE